jgi:site-specific recombinase XerD
MEKISQEQYFKYVAPFLEKISKEPNFINDDDIAQYLIEQNFRPGSYGFDALKNYFHKQLKLDRKVFPILEKKYPPADKSPDLSRVTLPGEKNLLQIMQAQRYSWRTIKSYTHALRALAHWAGIHFEKSLQHLHENEIMEYVFHRINVHQISVSSQNILRSAVLFYFRNVLHQNLSFPALRNTRKGKNLPNVLTRAEILTIVSQITNTRHKMAVALLYSSGLRISELVRLRAGNINLEKLTLKVRGKGSKDRLTIFSKWLKDDLVTVLKQKSPNDYLFHSGRNPFKHISERSIQKVFSLALKKSGVQRTASCHDLRHSFATHLMENGVAVRYIQKLLGHKNISTTTIYTQVTDPSIMKIQSPL